MPTQEDVIKQTGENTCVNSIFTRIETYLHNCPNNVTRQSKLLVILFS